ncbi:MAG: hypothetical protein LBN08_00090 [Lactobacillales bacterium]|jgi:hypothetical protein|nr:hypothetical protein [Lactobacillales bacterium]
MIEELEIQQRKEKMEHALRQHALGAAAAGFAAGVVPGAGEIAAMAVAVGFIWHSYYEIGKIAGVKLENHVIKAIGSAVGANIAATVISTLAIEMVVGFIPGLSMFAGAAIDFTIVQIAGNIFIKVLTKITNEGYDISDLSTEHLISMATECTKNMDIKEGIKTAKEEFKQAKKSGEFDKNKKMDLGDFEDE